MGTNAQVVTGTSEKRCSRIVIEKPKTGVPSVLFLEQKLITIDGEQLERPMPGIHKQFDETEKFDILDDDGKPTGKKSSYAEVFKLVRSAYLAAAAARDKQEADAAAGVHSLTAPDPTVNPSAPAPAPATTSATATK